MTHDQPADAPRRRWNWGKRLLISGIAFVVLVLIAWLTFGLIVEHQLAAEIARIREVGEPLTWHELHGDLKTTGAGLEYEAAFEAMDLISRELESAAAANAEERAAREQALSEAKHELGPEPLTDEQINNPPPPPPVELDIDDWDEPEPLNEMGPLRQIDELLYRHSTDTVTEEDVAIARRLLEAYGPVMARLDRAAAIDEFTFDLGVDEGLLLSDMPALARARQASSLLTMRGVLEARRGDLAAASGSATLAFRLARVARDQPMLLTYLVQIGIEHRAVRFISEISSYAVPPREQVAQLQTVLDEAFDTSGFKRAMIGERVYWVTVLDQSAEGIGEGAALSRMPWPLTEYWKLQYLSDMSEAVAVTTRPFPERTRILDIEPSGIFSGIFLPSFARVAVVEAYYLTDLRAARIGLAIAAYRRDRGELPASLQLLVPDYLPSVPLDPFDGQPLRYQVEDERYIVYSVGEDGDDDDGDVQTSPTYLRDDATDYGTEFRRR